MAAQLGTLAAILFLLSACVTTYSEPTPEAVAAYLAEDAKAHGTPPKWDDPPIIYIMDGATEEDAEHLRQSVAILNAFLPDSFQLHFDPKIKMGQIGPTPMPGDIWVFFIPIDKLPEGAKDWFGKDALGFALPINARGEYMPLEKDLSIIKGAVVYIDTVRIKERDLPPESTIIHELLHALGRTHMSSRFPHTAMHPGAKPPAPTYLYPLDIAVLQEIYGEG